jgi:hypothetical protein
MQGVRRAAVRALQAANNAAGRPSRPKKTFKLFFYESLADESVPYRAVATI